ncbi:unnamed protein product [Orchesella dallaii]|uniref:Uncharacterized protein n=1 Tax=Orchesella dallaii TaxID=48710 RepID=A0ABP1QD19_9HEXA
MKCFKNSTLPNAQRKFLKIFLSGVIHIHYWNYFTEYSNQIANFYYESNFTPLLISKTIYKPRKRPRGRPFPSWTHETIANNSQMYDSTVRSMKYCSSKHILLISGMLSSKINSALFSGLLALIEDLKLKYPNLRVLTLPTTILFQLDEEDVGYSVYLSGIIATKFLFLREGYSAPNTVYIGCPACSSGILGSGEWTMDVNVANIPTKLVAKDTKSITDIKSLEKTWRELNSKFSIHEPKKKPSTLDEGDLIGNLAESLMFVSRVLPSTLSVTTTAYDVFIDYDVVLEQHATDFFSLLRPLEGYTWAIIGFLTASTSCVLALSSKETFTHTWFLTVATLVEQGEYRRGLLNWKNGYLIIGWGFASIFFGFLYTSSMYTYLTMEPYPKNLPNSSDDLIFRNPANLQIFGDTNGHKELYKATFSNKTSSSFRRRYTRLLDEMKGQVMWDLGPGCATKTENFAVVTDGQLQYKMALRAFANRRIISLFGIWILNFIVLATDILEDITKLWATVTPRAASYLYVVQIFILSAKHLNVFWILATKKHEIEILLSRLYSYSFSRIKELDKQMTRFKGLLLNRSVKEKLFADKEEWGRLVQELEMKPIGIGAEGLYLINYGFLSQVCH